MVFDLEILARAGLSALVDGVVLCGKISLIVLPVMVAYELIKAWGILERPWPFLGRGLARLGLSPAVLMPLLAGVFLGIIYSAGILMAMNRDGRIGNRERLAVGAFLVVCHGVFEDTALFVLLGGNGPLIVTVRLVFALALCLVLAGPAGRWLAHPQPAEH